MDLIQVNSPGMRCCETSPCLICHQRYLARARARLACLRCDCSVIVNQNQGNEKSKIVHSKTRPKVGKLHQQSGGTVKAVTATRNANSKIQWRQPCSNVTVLYNRSKVPQTQRKCKYPENNVPRKTNVN